MSGHLMEKVQAEVSHKLVSYMRVLTVVQSWYG